MSESLEILALRKEVLRAQCSLQRLKIAQAIDGMHGNLHVPRLAALATSRAGRSLLLALLLLVAGRRRAGRWLRTAAVIFAGARLVGAFRRADGGAGTKPAVEVSKPAT